MCESLQAPRERCEDFSEYVSDKSQALLAHIIRSQPEDPMRQCTFEKDTNLPKIHINRRVGRPREQWASGAYKSAWQNHCNGNAEEFKANTLKCIQAVVSKARTRNI